MSFSKGFGSFLWPGVNELWSKGSFDKAKTCFNIGERNISPCRWARGSFLTGVSLLTNDPSSNGCQTGTIDNVGVNDACKTGTLLLLTFAMRWYGSADPTRKLEQVKKK